MVLVPGHGRPKKSQLPDVHGDCFFSVAGKELGFVFCCVVVVMFGSIVLRGFSHAAQKHHVFDRLCTSGSVFKLGQKCLLTLHLAQF